jgi:hypothetical protein
VIAESLIRANARRAVPGRALDVGAIVVVGEDGWGIWRAEVVDYQRGSGSLVLRLLDELADESSPSRDDGDVAAMTEVDVTANLNLRDDDDAGGLAPE